MNTHPRLLVLVLLAALLPGTAFAQDFATDRGSWLAGGTASLASHENDFDGERLTFVTFNPSVQYFVIPGLTVGGSLDLSYISQEDFANTLVGVGPEVGYYAGGPERRLFPFARARVTLLAASFNTGGGSGRNTNASLDLSAGGVLLIARNVGLTGEAFYQHTDFDFDDEGSGSNSFGLRFGIAAFVF